MKRSRWELCRYLYADQLGAWVEEFGAARVRVVLYEELRAAPGAVMGGVYEYLGLPRHRLRSYRRYNAGGAYPELDVGLRSRLEEFYAAANRRLVGVLGRDPGWGPGPRPPG